MPDYGLRVFDSLGNITLNLTDKITRLRYTVVAAANTSGSIDLLDISGLQSVEFAILVNPASWNVAPHSVSRALTTISWSPNSALQYSSGNSLIYVFLYT
jgi:hypothetical protein